VVTRGRWTARHVSPANKFQPRGRGSKCWQPKCRLLTFVGKHLHITARINVSGIDGQNVTVLFTISCALSHAGKGI
jgi:hypothetical protein